MAVDGQRFLTKTQHYRKVTKPLLERKRRARMNLYLDELKDLVVDFMEAEGEHVAKLEKADILEMTVNFLKLQKHKGRQRMSMSTGTSTSTVLHMEKFRDGYTQAAYDVSKLFATLPGLDLKFGTRLMQHLGCRLKDIKTNVGAAETSTSSMSSNSLAPPSSSSSSSSSSTLMLVQSSAQSAFHPQPSRLLPNASPSQMDLRYVKVEDLQARHEDVWRPW